MNKIVCSNANDFLKKLSPKSADLILTDPPYGVGISSWDDNAPIEWCKEISRVMKDDASLVIFCGKQNRFEVEKALRETGLNFWQELVWVYGNGGVTRKNSYNGHHEPILWFVKDTKNFHFDIEGKMWVDTWTVIDRARPQSNFKVDKKIHPTQKALEVVKRLVEYHSRKDDLVIDPFAGSGTTAVACKVLQRNFLGCDIDENYVDMANARLKSIKAQMLISKEPKLYV
jgi:DNA modification methylase